MTINLNARLDEQVALIQATTIGTLNAAVGDAIFVSLKNYAKATIILDVANAAATTTGGTVTLLQAKDVSGKDAKALSLGRYLANLDTAAGQTLAEVVAVADKFVTDPTGNKRQRYVLEICADQLDGDGRFDCFRVDVTGMANATGLVSYILWGARYSGAPATTD